MVRRSVVVAGLAVALAIVLLAITIASAGAPKDDLPRRVLGTALLAATTHP